ILAATGIGMLLTLLVASGVGLTFAYWNSQATVSTSASAATLSMTTSNFTSAAFTFRNNALSNRSSVTITNTTATDSTAAADLTIALDTASGNNALAAGIAVTVWRVEPGTNCAA